MNGPRASAAYWQSPSGLIHLRRECTGAAPAARMRRVMLTEARFAEADRCRCAGAWRGPDRFIIRSAPDPAFPQRTSYWVRDTHTGEEHGRRWKVRHKAVAEAARRNARYRAFRRGNPTPPADPFQGFQ